MDCNGRVPETVEDEGGSPGLLPKGDVIESDLLEIFDDFVTMGLKGESPVEDQVKTFTYCSKWKVKKLSPKVSPITVNVITYHFHLL